MRRGLPALIEADKELAPYFYKCLRDRLKKEGKQFVYLDGRPQPDLPPLPQGAGLAAGDISQFFANVPFADLAARLTDNSRVPVTGAMNRILASHLEPAQGAN